MKKIMHKMAAALLVCAALAAAGCSKAPEGIGYEHSERFISRVYINTLLSVYKGQRLAIQGYGFEQGDRLCFTAPEKSSYAALEDIFDSGAYFEVPDDLERGDYMLSVVRGDLSQNLCHVTVWITSSHEIPDKAGMNIKGAVFCGNEGLRNVLVSDGLQTTVTDENGFYWFNSGKEYGFVYISLPSGYMPEVENNSAPNFWIPLTRGIDTVEECSFELKKVDNDKHQVIFAADIHLANRNSAVGDMTQFADGFMTDSQALAREYGLGNTYCITLGDMTWDRYWYVQNYTPINFRNTIKDYCIPMFQCMGNHDNDPWVMGDFAGSNYYREVFGPNFYSINIGRVHYIILDSITWINTNGAQGVVGDRDFRRNMSDDEMKWLRADIKHVKETQGTNTVIVVCTHCPIYNNYDASFSASASFNFPETVSALDNIFADFKQVYYLAGHTHRNSRMTVKENIRQIVFGAVCECWWWSGKLTGRPLCSDGSPAGYGVFEVDGTNVEHYYRGSGCGRDEQFHAYDMNEVKGYLSGFADILNKQTDPQRDTRGNDYASVGNNVVYINVFAYDTDWKVEVTENGRTLDVVRIFDRDPLHTICYDIPRVQSGGSLTGDGASVRNPHMFSVQASTANSTLEIKVTDPYGHTYTETMTRPKAFDRNAR